MTRLFCAALLALWTGSAAAHSPLTATTPVDAAVLTDAPTEITMAFRGGIRLTRVTLTQDGTDAAPLDLAGHDGFVSDYRIPVRALAPGAYVVDWRGLGTDGHAMTGTFGFTVE